MGLPLIISTGMATLDEVRASVDVLRQAGGWEAALLHCVSDYPAKPEDVNLRAMHTLSREFGFPVGWSDHCEGLEIALAARALGACIIEKHFTLDRTLAGPDHASSLEPDELRDLVLGIRRIELALGDGEKVPSASEAETANAARRSLVLACAVEAGHALKPEQLVVKRPGTGISPGDLATVIGRRVRHALTPDSVLHWEDLLP
jgi:sialic acid synthase SpsE